MLCLGFRAMQSPHLGGWLAILGPRRESARQGLARVGAKGGRHRGGRFPGTMLSGGWDQLFPETVHAGPQVDCFRKHFIHGFKSIFPEDVLELPDRRLNSIRIEFFTTHPSRLRTDGETTKPGTARALHQISAAPLGRGAARVDRGRAVVRSLSRAATIRSPEARTNVPSRRRRSTRGS